jgi:hypothetical protein
MLAVGETREVTFPAVTRFFYVRNVTAAATILTVAFSSNGLKTANSNFFTLSGTQSQNFDLRVKSLFLSNSSGLTGFEIVAGLTGIPAQAFPSLSASLSYSGIG